MKTSGIGGQSVMEGVMMRNKGKYAVAVRKADNTIEVKTDEYKGITKGKKFFKLPIIRGVVAFVDSMVLGMKTLTYSAELVEEEDEVEEPGAFEKFLIKIFKEKAADIVMGIVVIFSILIAVGLFVLLPTFAAGLLGGIIKSEMMQTVVEGGIRLLLFLLYVFLISFMKEIKRTYMYHGAEHKCINCIENGLELTVENVRKSSRFHKRCGTSFIFVVLFLSIILFMFIRTDVLVLKLLFRLLLIPVIAGISFEFIQGAGKKDSFIFNILSQPGMWLQRITTREPDDSMIEVGIASVEAVFDWKEFISNMSKENQDEESDGFEVKADFTDEYENDSESGSMEAATDNLYEESFDMLDDLEDATDDDIQFDIDLEDTGMSKNLKQFLDTDEAVDTNEEDTMGGYYDVDVDPAKDIAEVESYVDNSDMDNVDEESHEDDLDANNAEDESYGDSSSVDNSDENNIEDDLYDESDYEDEEEEPASPKESIFSRFKKEKKPSRSVDRPRRHKAEYDEDYDESDEILAELDAMFAEKKEK